MNASLLNHIDGKGLYIMFLAGANRILQHQIELNKINVFPVPDGDTGTNLASTVRTIIEQIKGNKEYKHSAEEIAEAALDGARGNSGVIFAQFLHGLRKETKNLHKVNLHDFAVALNNSVKYVYEAISNPVEGTMITVIREWSEYFYENRFSKRICIVFRGNFRII
jgi:fatty acid kinase/fatty acid kinase fatty acid binding subunit